MRKHNWFTANFRNLLKNEWLTRFYDAGIEWVFAHKKPVMAFAFLSLPLCVLMFRVIGKERMPKIDQNETVVSIEWNENIHVDENNRRVNAILAMTDSIVEEHTAYVGMQDYLLGTENELSAAEAELYFRTAEPSRIPVLTEMLGDRLRREYPAATVTFSPPVTIFEKLFVTGEPDLVAQLRTSDRTSTPEASDVRKMETDIAKETGYTPYSTPFRSQLNLEVDRNRLLIYNVGYDEVVRVLRTALKDNQVSTLRSYQQYLPIGIAGREMSVNRILAETLVETNADAVTKERNYIPLRELVRVFPDEDLKEITAGRNGEYIPVNFHEVDNVPQVMDGVRRAVDKDSRWDVSFGGSFFSNKKMMGELTVILLISVLLMYFILCAQFESFVQPLIVLAEIPIDIAFGIVLLWATGHTMNLMSAIGIIVSCGIVVNDSILKLDSINELRKEGMPLLDAIHTAGHRRLRAIIMTTLTTVFAMVPLLFTSDMGSEIQRPLSVAMIGTMMVGLVVSLFVIPLIYWFIYAQTVLKLDLEKTITMANDSSLSAFRFQNMYLSGYWEYRSYKAARLPSLRLNMTPAQYYRNITRRYDSGQDIDVYREQQMFSAGAGLNLAQNFDLLGGTFYVDTQLDYMRNFGDSKSNQFSTIPFRIGYQQNLLGFNPFRWDRKIEPLKFEKIKKQYLYNAESVSEEAVNYFFSLAMAQAEYRLAQDNVATTDTLYAIGEQRQKIASISQADLLTLKLDKVNARNTLKNAEISRKRAMSALATFLNMDRNSYIEVDLPARPRHIDIPADRAIALAHENNPKYVEQRQNVLEAEREVDRAKKEARFNASFNASMGFNQVADNISAAYRNMLQQDLVSFTVSIPLVDWGVRKGKYNIAKNNLNVVKIAARQEEISLEEDVMMTVSDFSVQQDMIASAEEALDLADLAYDQTRRRFIIGKADINSLTLALNRQQEARKNYIQALQNYWLNYYKIRKLTLHDFESGMSLADRFDFDNHLR